MPTRPKGSPNDALRHANAALAAEKRGDLAEADRLYAKALAILPDQHEFLTNRAACKINLSEYAAAATLARKALAHAPTHPLTLGVAGMALFAIGELDEAEALLERCVASAPRHYEAFAYLGLIESSRRRPEAALEHFKRCLSLKPDYARAWEWVSTELVACDRREEAVAPALRALALRPRSLEAVIAARAAVQDVGRWDEFPALDRAYAEAASRPEAFRSLQRGAFEILSRAEDRAACRAAARAEARQIVAKHPATATFAPRRVGGSARVGPLRVGYVSADFHDHATMHLSGAVLEAHDPSRVAFVCFSNGPDRDDAERRRLIARAEAFVDIRGLNSHRAAELARSHDLDLAIDLKGYTSGHRLDVFSRRIAPVQATWLGFPGTLGAPFIDYLIADRIVAPPEHAEHYDETLAYHPLCYQPNDAAQDVSAETTSRADWGLPAEGPVLASFNALYKLEPVRFDAWAAVLAAVPDGVLWLLCREAAARARLLAEAERRGVGPERIVFADTVSKPRHLERLRHATLALDTRVYNGHTTTTDALLAGVPVVARLGDHFPSRVSASVLSALGLTELIAPDEAAFVALCIDICRSEPRRAALRDRLAQARREAPVWAPRSYASALEALYRRMVEHGPRDVGARRPPIAASLDDGAL